MSFDKSSFYSEISRNNWKTRFLFFGFFIFFLIVGFFIGEAMFESSVFGIFFALIIAVPYSLVSYYAGPSIALAASGAREADPVEFKPLHDIVEGLSIAAGLPKPKLYVIDDPSPNAFATGRDEKTASIAVTTGLLRIMNKQELEGVIAHELGHILNNDMKLMTMAAVLVGGIGLLSNVFLRSFRSSSRSRGSGVIIIIGVVFAILAPIIARLISLAISRSREFLADATAAKITRYPYGLASALEKLKQVGTVVQTASESTAHLFIANPLKQGFLTNLFSTHPPLEERIARLKAM